MKNSMHFMWPKLGHSRPTQKVRSHRHCNLCEARFHPKTAFDRYCQHCREENELLRFGDWLPDLDEALTAKVSA